jgi:hypothetical protein
MFPTMGTCNEDGVQPTDCSQECLFACKTPMCSMSCLCACDTAEAKASLVSTLKAEQTGMQREMKLMAVQATMWRAAQAAQHGRAFKAREKHRIHSLMMKQSRKERSAQQPSAQKVGFIVCV